MTDRFPRRCAPALAAVAALTLLPARPAAAQDDTRSRVFTRSDVRDGAGMFGADAVTKAKEVLTEVQQKDGLQAVVETVGSLRGDTPEALARRNVRINGVRGVYVLIARSEAKFEMVVTPGFNDRLRARQDAIRDAFLNGLKARDFDRALLDGVAAIRDAAAATRVEDRPRGQAVSAGERGGLVTRNQVRLTLAGARRIIAGAEAQAAELGLKMNIAVVDDGGHLLTFDRMDGARPASGYTAITKATTAATFRQETGPIPKGADQPDVLLNLSLQNAAAASGGKVTTLYGGVPVVVDGQVIGGVGVGGGSGEQDAQVARAGIEAFLSDLNAPSGRDGKDREREKADDGKGRSDR